MDVFSPKAEEILDAAEIDLTALQADPDVEAVLRRHLDLKWLPGGDV